MSILLSNSKNGIKNIDEEKQELNEVRNKILKRVALKNANNMMVNGELLLNGSTEYSGENINDDIKFIDSDSDNLSDKRMSPQNNGSGDGSLNNIAAATNHITKMLATATPINSNSTTTMTRNTTNNTVTLNKTNTYPPKPTKTNIITQILPTQNSVSISPSNKKLILNASPKNSCVYEKQQQKQNLLQKLSINSEAEIINNGKLSSKMDGTTTVALTSGSNRLRIITSNDTDDDDDFTNVSTSATIILPSKAKQNGMKSSVGGETIVANNHDSHKDNSSDASTIILEKKNLANHKQISDTNDTSVSSPI